MRVLPAGVWGEIAMSAILAPLQQADLRAPFCPRLECVDAASWRSRTRMGSFSRAAYP